MSRPDVLFRQETVLAIEAVERALTMARRRSGESAVFSKGDRDPVTATDLAIEDAIRNMIGEPSGFPIVGEERGGEAPPNSAPYWLLDPICGTRNFASRIPLCCVNVALVEDGRVTVAVVGNPWIPEIHVAERDQGAWALREGVWHQLLAGDESRIIAIEDGTTKGARRERVARFAAAVIRADRWDLRAFGTSLSLSYVAAGQIAAYVLFSSSPVHFGAGSLMVTEAGAFLTDTEGKPWTLRSDSALVSASSELHEDLLTIARTAAASS
jgi:myo-inositol-1(or 4)-monophosphatase